VRRWLVRAHLIVGVTTAPVLALLGLTGAIMVFEPQIVDAANASLLRVAPSARTLRLDDMAARLRAAYPGAHVDGVSLAEDATHADAFDVVRGGDPRGGATVFVDPHTGRILGTADALRARWLGTVHQLHTRLLAGEAGASVVGWTAVALLFLAVTGLVLWWPGKILRVRRTTSGKRVVLDVHSALGAYSWIFLMLFALTGAALHWEDLARRLVASASGGASDPPPPAPSHACEGKPALGLDRLAAAAAAAVPGATPSWLQVRTPTGLARMVMRFPEDRTPAGRTVVAMEPCTARVVSVQSTRAASLAFRATRMWAREAHTGDLFGWPTRILAALFSLSLPLMAVTGPLIWLSRRRRPSRPPAARPAARRREAVPA
jgi:uncharacterized iron-regulated membrane protein